jgi:hypothetical protein
VPLFLVPRGRDPLPQIALLRVRLEAAVDLRHHGDVPVPELTGDQLEGSASAGHPHRPVVPGVVQAVALEPERPEPLAVQVAGLPAVYPAKNSLTWEHRLEVLLQLLLDRIQDLKLREEEIHAAVRAAGLGSLHEAQAVVLETDGEWSVIARADAGDLSAFKDLDLPGR